MVKDLKESNPRQWYSKLKRMSSIDKQKGESFIIESLMGVSDAEQAEKIADQFAEISQQYEPLTKESIPPETYESENSSMFFIPFERDNNKSCYM